MMTKDLHAHVRQLESILDRLAGLYDRLLEVLEEKREALVQVDRNRIPALNEHEEALAISLSVADEGRAGLMEAISDQIDGEVEGGSLTLGALIESIDDPDLTAELALLRERLRELAHHVRGLVETNRALTEQSLDHVTFVLRVLAGAEESSPIYDRSAQEVPSSAFSVMNRQA